MTKQTKNVIFSCIATIFIAFWIFPLFWVFFFFLIYRKDLIKDPPQTWEELFELAKRFRKATNPDSPTPYAITGDYITGETLPQTWWNIMWSMGGQVIDANGNVVVDEDAAVKSAQYLYRLAQEKLVPPNLTQVGWTDHEDQFINGDAAIIVPGWNAAVSTIPAKGGKYADQLASTLIPGTKQPDGSILRTPYAHSWNFVINGASKNPEAAWQFMQYATSKEGMTIYAKTGLGNPPRESVMGGPEIQKERPDFAIMLESLTFAHWADPVVYFNKIFEALDIALSEIINMRQTPEQALEEAARKIREAKEKG
jgi:multiple sugar transport system substrate-binding protein